MKKKETDQKRGSEEKRRAKVWWKARIVVLVMICTGLIQWPERMDTGVNGVCVFAQPVSGETTEADAVRQADSEGSASIDNSQEKQLTDQLELTDLQSMVDEMLGENSFSVTEAFHRLLSGEEVLSEESVREFLHSLLFSSLEKEKSLIVKLLLLLLFAAVFSGFAGAFDNGQIGEISFYVVYLLVFTLLMNSFSGLSASLLSILRWITEFMKELSREICEQHGGTLISAETDADHMHLLISMPPQERPSDLIRVLKTQTSKKVHQNKDYNQYIKQYLLGNVPLWSPSYFIATTGGATLEKVKEYVESQRTDDHKRKYQKTGRYRKQRKK